MTTQTLDTPTAPWPYQWLRSFTLEGEVYWFSAKWNDRDGFWYLAVGSSNLVSQAQGVPLLLATDILRSFKYGVIPPGRLDVIDTSGLYVEPSREDMGTRVLIQYTDFVEVVPASRELFPAESPPPS
jgi:hypothetical protein